MGMHPFYQMLCESRRLLPIEEVLPKVQARYCVGPNEHYHPRIHVSNDHISLFCERMPPTSSPANAWVWQNRSVTHGVIEHIGGWPIKIYLIYTHFWRFPC